MLPMNPDGPTSCTMLHIPSTYRKIILVGAVLVLLVFVIVQATSGEDRSTQLLDDSPAPTPVADERTNVLPDPTALVSQSPGRPGWKRYERTLLAFSIEYSDSWSLRHGDTTDNVAYLEFIEPSNGLRWPAITIYFPPEEAGFALLQHFIEKQDANLSVDHVAGQVATLVRPITDGTLAGLAAGRAYLLETAGIVIQVLDGPTEDPTRYENEIDAVLGTIGIEHGRLK